MIGDDDGPTYFIVNKDNGDIILNRDLKQTNAESLTVSRS